MSLDESFMNIATERRAFLALVVFIASTAILWYLNPEKKIRENVNVGDKYLSIGMTFGYKPDDLYTMLDGFSEQNTKDERFYLIMDLFYPVLYGFSLAILLAYLQSKYPIASPGRFHYLWVLPLCAIVFDWGENISMIWIQSNYKKRTPGLMEVSDSLRRVTEFSRIMTMLKLLFIYASFFMAVFAVLFLIQSGWKALRPARAS